MTDPESVEALAKRLDHGTVDHAKRWSGDTHDDLGGSVDCDATDALMGEAAAALRAQAAEIERLRGELADGSFYKESDIDALQARAEKAEAAPPHRLCAGDRGCGEKT